MKAAVLVESLTGNTWRAAELVADDLRQEGWTITGLDRLRSPDLAAIQAADIVLVGTWVHGFFVVGQAPWALSTISNLPAMRGKQAAVFCTFALNPGKEAAKALSIGAEFQVAWPFTHLDIGNLQDFVDRWASWFADAAQGRRLQHPATMPERRVEGSWRRT